MSARFVGLACACLLLSPADASSQIRSSDVFFAGSLGTSASEVRGGGINTDFKWGGMGGIAVGWRPSRGSVVGLEANYAAKGGKDLNLNYIEFPLTVGVSGQTGNGSNAARLYTGIGFGFRVGCSSDLPNPARDCDNANSTEWTWPVGVMLGRWNADRALIALDARYSIGLSRTHSNLSGLNYAWQFRIVVGKASFRR